MERLSDYQCGCYPITRQKLWLLSSVSSSKESESVSPARTCGNTPMFPPVHSLSWISLWAFTQHHLHPIWRSRWSTPNMMGSERCKGTGLEVWKNNKTIHILLAECHYQQIWLAVTMIHGFNTVTTLVSKLWTLQMPSLRGVAAIMACLLCVPVC